MAAALRPSPKGHPMTVTIERPRAATSSVGYLTIAVLAAWIVFAAADTLEPNGRHLLVLGALRVVLLGALLTFASVVGADRSRAGRVVLAVAGLGVALNFVGGVGAVLTDGWSYNPFAAGVTAPAPWYAYLVGVGAILFAVGTVAAGIVGRSGGWLALAVVLSGLLYLPAVALGPDGHFVWAAAWVVVGVGLATRRL